MKVKKLFEYVSRQSAVRPSSIAIVMGDQRLTYRQLDNQSDKLASLLIYSGCKPGDRVALMLPKEPQTIVCLLAVMKAGCIYVPVDINNPADRLAKMMSQTKPAITLASSASSVLLSQMATTSSAGNLPQIGWMDDYLPEGFPYPIAFTKDDVNSKIIPEYTRVGDLSDIAHILYTSGSTGMPKGVMVTHSNVIRFTEWAKGYFNMSSRDRVSGHAPLHFDLSTFDIYGAFASGAELHMVPPDIGIIPKEIAGFIEESRLTQWFSVPSLLSYMARFDAIQQDAFPHLKRMIWCGEVFPVSPLRYWMQRLPHVQFTNLYGPTETTIASSYYTLPEIPESDSAELPIGRPCDGEDLIILDEHMKDVPDGEIGELYIKGDGLTMGYWQNREKSDQVFLRLSNEKGEAERVYKTGDLARKLHSGLVYYHGRIDNQIKTRGYRVELGEVENALLRIPGVKACAVVPYHLIGMDTQGIGCAFEMKTAYHKPDLVKLRKKLAEYVPAYAIPSKWIELDELPKNGNGKIDRKIITHNLENHGTTAHS